MPWTKTDYPNSMKNLPKEVRNKAIEIGDALLEKKNMEEGIAIATAVSRAKDWAAEHGRRLLLSRFINAVLKGQFLLGKLILKSTLT